MGGHPGELTGETFVPFRGTAQPFFDVNGGEPRAAAQNARLELFLDAVPGLAGALHSASVYRSTPVRPLGTRAAPRSAAGLGGVALPSQSRLGPDYPDQPVLGLVSAGGRRQAPVKHPGPKVSQSPPGPPTATALDTKDNINDLARIINSEASTGNYAERSSVAFTVVNRMRRNATARVKDVSTGYAHSQAATPDAVLLATRILKNQLADPSNGATHFYSPSQMPKEGGNTAGFDISGGLERSGHLKKKNYRPGYAKT